MPSFDVVRGSLSDYYRMIHAQIHELTAALSSEQLWVRPYDYGNSIGNLILHLTGNLNYYIGARIGGSGYVRHRDLEFSDSGQTKDALLKNFDQAIEIVLATLAKQSNDDWSAPFSAETLPECKTRFAAIVSCAGHAYHHVGQIIYLQRELIGKSATGF
jgi:hypothetical protein